MTNEEVSKTRRVSEHVGLDTERLSAGAVHREVVSEKRLRGTHSRHPQRELVDIRVRLQAAHERVTRQDLVVEQAVRTEDTHLDELSHPRRLSVGDGHEPLPVRSQLAQDGDRLLNRRKDVPDRLPDHLIRHLGPAEIEPLPHDAVELNIVVATGAVAGPVVATQERNRAWRMPATSQF